MLKKIESVFLHFVIVFFRRLFRFLLRKCHVDFDDTGVLAWYKESCGLFECFYDYEIMQLFWERCSDTVRKVVSGNAESSVENS